MAALCSFVATRRNRRAAPRLGFVCVVFFVSRTNTLQHTLQPQKGVSHNYTIRTISCTDWRDNKNAQMTYWMSI